MHQALTLPTQAALFAPMAARHRAQIGDNRVVRVGRRNRPMPMCKLPSQDNPIAAAIMSAVDAVHCRRAALRNPEDAAFWKIMARYQSLQSQHLLDSSIDPNI